MPTPYEKEMELLRKLLAEIETDKDSDFENEGNGPENNLEENFSDHESFFEHDTESEEAGNSGNEEVNITQNFLYQKIAYSGVKQKFRKNIRTRCHNIVSRLPGTKGPEKDVTSPEKSWELFIDDNVMQLIVDCTNTFIEKSSPNLSRERYARKTDPQETQAL
ncbi:hypothetical protein AVEN_2123-1 [Araneus ventricosus]|uniref:PiggyBac transposable element-derived protein domain-containing protein n=1 Tax=Araneus ventricosus TaxID=182803 RepID=A0A4Y2EA02_ARAVE|nr:hypothetical protein AVEN_2123-1 [Araneus ventricosus]